MAIITANTIEHFTTIEALAWRILPECYAPYFGRTNAEYLVESGHTAEALAAQAAKGYRHYLIEVADNPQSGLESDRAGGTGNGRAVGAQPVGYFSLCAEEEHGVLLSHFYVLPEFRGRGLGGLALEFIDREVTAMGGRRIELFVLRENHAAVGLYRKKGYTVAEEVLTRLGNGAVLEDYVMRKDVEY
jgi:ribosomal protein S18 acetylase RimI-like enzyme